MKVPDIDCKHLSRGSSELIREFLLQYSKIEPDEITGENFKDITISECYRQASAIAAYDALAQAGLYPNLYWGLESVTFTLNSGIPNTVHVYNGPNEVDLLTEHFMTLAGVLGLMFFLSFEVCIYLTTPSYSSVSVLIGMIVWVGHVFCVAPIAAYIFAKTRYKL
jgi:hypothetical protein